MTKIMLVEDDKSLREIYSIRLVAEGYNIVSAGDGEEGLALAVQEKPDLIISDVMMPKISGFDMLDILRSTPETANVKVIMMTALSSDDQRQRGEVLGANKYLVKSQVGIEDVVNAVHELLGDSPNTNAAGNLDTVAAIPIHQAAPGETISPAAPAYDSVQQNAVPDAMAAPQPAVDPTYAQQAQAMPQAAPAVPTPAEMPAQAQPMEVAQAPIAEQPAMQMPAAAPVALPQAAPAPVAPMAAPVVPTMPPEMIPQTAQAPAMPTMPQAAPAMPTAPVAPQAPEMPIMESASVPTPEPAQAPVAPVAEMPTAPVQEAPVAPAPDASAMQAPQAPAMPPMPPVEAAPAPEMPPVAPAPAEATPTEVAPSPEISGTSSSVQGEAPNLAETSFSNQTSGGERVIQPIGDVNDTSDRDRLAAEMDAILNGGDPPQNNPFNAPTPPQLNIPSESANEGSDNSSSLEPELGNNLDDFSSKASDSNFDFSSSNNVSTSNSDDDIAQFERQQVEEAEALMSQSNELLEEPDPDNPENIEAIKPAYMNDLASQLSIEGGNDQSELENPIAAEMARELADDPATLEAERLRESGEAEEIKHQQEGNILSDEELDKVLPDFLKSDNLGGGSPNIQSSVEEPPVSE